MKIRAQFLRPGDKIPAPAHERKWLKTLLTVVTVENGNVDKGGLWLKVKATFASPYGDKISDGVFRFRPDTLVVKS